MSLPVPLRWPSLLPSITATTSERWKGWREWYFKYSIIAGFEDCASLREKPQRPRLCFLCVSLQKKKTGLRSYFSLSVDVRWRGESGVFVSLVSPYIFISICRLMAFRQDVQCAVDRANENVSQPCVPRWARSVSARWKTRRRYRPTLCCAVSDWWLSVVALWLGLQWFITAAHNVIRLYIYIYTRQTGVGYIAGWSQYLCVCTGTFACYLHIIIMWLNLAAYRVCLKRFQLKE